MKKNILSGFERVVIKVGSALLIDKRGHFNKKWLKKISEEIASLHEEGVEVLVVSSGAVAIGCILMDRKRSELNLNDLQATAAMGQAQLVLEWQDAFKEHEINVGQILLTPEDTENKKRFLNSKSTLESLIEFNVIPVINENDTVATDELRYGDNDRLAARVAQMVMADGLILLSDVDGLYESDPNINQHAKHIPIIEDVSDQIISMAGSKESNFGSGGMLTKLQAAKIATHAGCVTIISDGTKEKPLKSLMKGGRYSLFNAKEKPMVLRKQWLVGCLDVKGVLKIDNGAQKALEEGGSLLPVGLLEVKGDFERGDVVNLMNSQGNEIGRGLAAYSSSEANIIIGCQSDLIIKRLGYKGRSEIVHRDDMALF